MALYDYDETIRDLIYKVKGCGDIELRETFLERYINIFKIKYKDYYLVPAPSYYEDDNKRGFNHVIEIYRCLGLEPLYIFEKIDDYKQAGSNVQNRQNIGEHIKTKNINLYGKKILIVDDVYTTGSTIRFMIKQLRKMNPKTIKILVVAKTKRKVVAN